MKKSTEEVVQKLLTICQSCAQHKSCKDAYTSPGFAEFLGRPLTIEDIPMEGTKADRSLTVDPGRVPWEDSVKNFILDTTSIQPPEQFSICILLVEYGYTFIDMRDKFLEATASIVAKKYGNHNTTVITVIPIDEEANNFKICTSMENVIGYSDYVESGSLTSLLLSFYLPGDTLIISHDNYIEEYKIAIQMMADSRWSLSCLPGNFITSPNKYKTCKYVLPVFSCIGSTETRAVGRGPVNFEALSEPKMYIGRMNYYLRHVRGSKNSSGRCYDCQTLYKTLISLGASPTSSPVPIQSIKFSDIFIESDNE